MNSNTVKSCDHKRAHECNPLRGSLHSSLFGNLGVDMTPRQDSPVRSHHPPIRSAIRLAGRQLRANSFTATYSLYDASSSFVNSR